MDTEATQQLANRPVDHITSVVKAAVGALPVVGSFLSEVAGVLIPNQRLDRLAKFAEALAARLEDVRQDVLRAKLGDENFTDLLEESLWQVARSTSDERRAYIAALLSNGVKSEDISHIENKHLLRILGELNDIEVIWLRAYYEWHWGDRNSEFQNRHAEILNPVGAHLGSSRGELDKEALQESYKAHMEQLGLLRPRYRVDSKTKMPEFDSNRGMKRSGYEISPLGQLLVRQIGMLPEQEKA
jgi:hypothetical protein